jgi:hypothetical protein
MMPCGKVIALLERDLAQDEFDKCSYIRYRPQAGTDDFTGEKDDVQALECFSLQ